MGIGVSDHHVTECAFHKHDAGEKRKMLGGVSFDGGAGSAAKGNTHAKAGVQTTQPLFSDWHKMEIGYGIKAGFLNGSHPLGKENDEYAKKAADKNRKDTVSIISVQDKRDKEDAANALKNIEDAAYRTASALMPDMEREGAEKMAGAAENIRSKDNRRFPLDYKKYIGKLQNGIQAFLKGMEQRAGKEGRQQPKKKESAGTRTVTKEEMYEMQVHTAYLLDSYNKNGERSMLGKE